MTDNSADQSAETGRHLVALGPRRDRSQRPAMPSSLISQILATRPKAANTASRPANPALGAYARTGAATQRPMPVGYRHTSAA
jgi:hypothetical protein